MHDQPRLPARGTCRRPPPVESRPQARPAGPVSDGGSQCDTLSVMEQDRSVQRSFRLARTTADLLDLEAESAGTSRNALADRLLGEALRLEHHPLIRFVQGAAGRRQAVVAGTRLYVHQVVATARAHRGSVEETATYFDLSTALVRAALDYYADFESEVDAAREATERTADAERRRWERRQHALA